ncbi:MAG TPA: methyltransferase domain-containing protein [Terriglobia bacterium]|nr:methyltransferase domain-containing protein [Terriglobia bacterium]
MSIQAVIEAPFDSVAESYDRTFTESFVGRAQRNLVWREMDQLFQPGQRILEINCGTGVDAIHLAQQGIRVRACDASSAMISVARARAATMDLTARVEFRVLRTEEIHRLSGEPPFDGLLSNFSGLNCIRDLRRVACALARLLKSGAKVLLCVFGRYCVWEILWNLAHGNLKRAFRRLPTASGSNFIGGQKLYVRYWSVSEIRSCLSPYFSLKRRAGLGITVPPSYLEPLTGRFPAIFRRAANIDKALSGAPIFRDLADHALLTFERL